MNLALRPMSTGEVLDRTFGLYRKYFLLFVGIGTLPALVLVGAFLLMLPFGMLSDHGALNTMGAATFIAVVAGYFIFVGIFYFAGYSVAMGATVHAVSHVHLGHPATIRDSYKKVRPDMLRILFIVIRVLIRAIGAFLLTYLLVLAIVIWMMRMITLNRAVLNTIITVLILGTLLVGLVFSIVIFCKYALAVPACVLEKLRPYQSLKRSRSLAKGSLFRIFLVMLLMGIVGAALSFIFQLPGMILSNYAGDTVVSIFQLFGSFIGSALAFPIGTIALSLLYYDQRVRKEAFDLQLMMESLAQPEPIAPVAPTIG
jgi:hypothetical protein